MSSKQSSESDLRTPHSAEPVDLIVRAALSAVNCGAALEIGDLVGATEHLGNLREAIASLERSGAGDRHDVNLLRGHELRLSERLFTGQYSLVPASPLAGASGAR
jgi:hypothetical protein